MLEYIQLIGGFIIVVFLLDLSQLCIELDLLYDHLYQSLCYWLTDISTHLCSSPLARIGKFCSLRRIDITLFNIKRKRISLVAPRGIVG
jgi:hypothetical protein